MKYFTQLLAVLLLIVYAHQAGAKTVAGDTVAVKKSSDSAIVELSKGILKAMKARDYRALAGYIHPVQGVRFTPYSFVDAEKDRVLKAADIKNISKSKKKLNWGDYDGSGEPIKMTAEEYFKRFVYDADFLGKGEITVNKVIYSGNTVNNVTEAYPGCEFVEFMIPMVDPQYEGADWRALRLVFKKENGKYYLIGVIHNESTT